MPGVWNNQTIFLGKDKYADGWEAKKHPVQPEDNSMPEIKLG